ncbi:MAG: hypothetical protein JSS49_30070 [Planctomycetes bacterium]|nr:hypothetical protein [Planctomycetota bacterium]
MTTDVNTAEDLLLVDNVQTVTLTLKRASGDVSIDIDHANNGPLDKNLEASYGTEGNVYSWTIPDVELNPAGDGREIRPLDELNDGTHDYVVVASTNGACGGKWTLTTNRKK